MEKIGLGNTGQVTMSKKVNKWIEDVINLYSEAKTIAIVGMADKRNVYAWLCENPRGFEVTMYDYDPQRADDNVITADVIFDDIELTQDLIINYACEKMWPLGKIYKGKEFILIGDNEHHNGDCNFIDSNKQLVEQNGITELWEFNEIRRWKGTYFMVAGCN